MAFLPNGMSQKKLTKTKDELGEEILERSLMFLLCAWV
jgi:hypothetical protein